MSLCTAGCAVAPERVNADCRWTHDPPAALDARSAAGERHLAADAVVAEDLAIRYADAHHGFRSGRYTNARDYTAARERCLTAMLDAAGAAHGVGERDVRALVGRRAVAFDAIVVIAPMVLLFCAASDVVVRRILRRFARDEVRARAVSFAAAAIVLVLVAYQAGLIWSLFAEEEIRLRSNHLSYRAWYVPWSRHPIAVIAAGFGLFALVALARSRMIESGFASAGSSLADRSASLRAGSSIGRAADS